MTDITRRTALKLSGQAFLALAAAGPLAASTGDKESTAIGWDQFLELCEKLAESQFADPWNQSAYTTDIQKLLKMLRINDPEIERFIARYRNAYQGFPEIRHMHRKQSFEVVMLEFEAGEEIGLHDHPDMTGVTFCTEGSLNVAHYDRLEQTADSGNPLLQEHIKMSMSRGDSAALTATTGNIHTLKADKFTRLIDVFTPPYNHDRSRRSKYYRLDQQPYKGQPGLFEAEVL